MGLYLLRHCVTNNNIDKVFTGRIDMEICEKPEIDFNGLTISSKAIVFCSSMIRCRQTARLLSADVLAAEKIYYSELLVERCFGIFEGRRKNTVQNEYPEFFSDGEFDFLQTPPEGESYDEFCRRIVSFWNKFNIISLAKHQDVVIISHSNVLRAISRMYLNERLFAKSESVNFLNGKVYHLTTIEGN